MKFKIFFLLLTMNSLALAWWPNCLKSDPQVTVTYQDGSAKIPQSFIEEKFPRLVPDIGEDKTIEAWQYNDIILFYVLTKMTS